MDKGGHHPGVGVQKGGYKPAPDQTQSRPSMRDIMAIISERDAALLERNLPLSEKKVALQERDMAVLERDAAIVERGNAIKERDEVISHPQLFDNLTGTGNKKKGYTWAILAGINAALAAVSAKFFTSQLMKYSMVIFFNVTMWGCYVNSLKALSSLQATVTNFATNFLSSGLAGFFLFKEALSYQWFIGALLVTVGVLILSKSSIERKTRMD